MGSLLSELRRRNVIRMAGLYLVVAWLVVQVAGTVLPMFGAPAWVARTIVLVLAIGLVPALLFAWLFELTPDGLKWDADVAAEHSIAPLTGRRMDRLIVIGLLAVIGLLLIGRWWPAGPEVPVRPADSAIQPSIARALPAARKSVAVLPFEDLSPGHDQEWFADGLTEEILNSLARLPELTVTARTSAFSFKASGKTIPEIANRLGVENVVDGSIRRAGNRLRVSARLIRAKDGLQLWSETYERDASDVFAVQEEIAGSVARMLDVYLDQARRRRMFSFGTRNPEALDVFLRGRAIFEDAHARDGLGGLWRANALFDRAIELDPTFAAPYQLRYDAYVHYLLGDIAAPRGSSLDEAQAERRIQQDLGKAAGLVSDPMLRATYEIDRTFLSRDWSGVPALIADYDRLLADASQPMLAQSSWANMLMVDSGRADVAQRMARRELQTNPLDARAYSTLAIATAVAGDPGGAQAILSDAERLLGEVRILRAARLTLALRRGALIDLKPFDSLVRDHSAMRAMVAAALVLRGDSAAARALVKPRPGQPCADDASAIWALNELGETASANAVAARVDACPLGPVALQRLMYYAGGTAPFDVARTPNLSERLREAGVRVAAYQPLPRPAR